MTPATVADHTGLALAFASADHLRPVRRAGPRPARPRLECRRAVTVRIPIAAAVLVVPGALAMRGRWHLLRDNAGLITAYGVAAVAGAQLCYFYAVTYMQVRSRC